MVSRFVSKHSTLPVLENIYIKGHIDEVVFRASDMEKYINIQMPANIDNEWAITVNAKTFTDLVKTIEDEEINLIIDESNDIMHIKTTWDDFKIKWIPANEYVAVPEVMGWKSIKIAANAFSLWVSKVEYAVTERNFSPVLTWVFMRTKKYDDGNKLVFVWTDSFRLSEYKVDYEWDINDVEIIIPKLNIWDIKKVADYFASKWGEDMSIVFSDSLVSFEFNVDEMKILTTSILIQWKFPEYENENIIPTKFNTKAIVEKSDLEKSIRKINILTRDINNFIDISVEPKLLVVKSGETDKWEWFTNLNAVVDGENINFGINWKYVLDYIRTIDNNKMVLNIVNGEKPIVFKDSDDKNYTYIVRPLVK